MFGWFKSKKSPLRQRVEQVSGVKRTWIEWTIDNGVRTPTLVVDYAWDLDPASPDHFPEGFAEIMAAVDALEAGEAAPPRVRVLRRSSYGE